MIIVGLIKVVESYSENLHNAVLFVEFLYVLAAEQANGVLRGILIHYLPMPPKMLGHGSTFS